MKTRESRLQNGIFVYKRGISLTKQESHLQNGSLALQTGLSGFYLPRVQTREIESENPYEKVTKMVTKIEIISIGSRKY